MTLLPDFGLIPVRLRFMQALIVCGSATVPLELTKAATPVNFQSGFLRQGQDYDSETAASVLNQLSVVESLGPGDHWVEIHVNMRYFGQRQIRFDCWSRSAYASTVWPTRPCCKLPVSRWGN